MGQTSDWLTVNIQWPDDRKQLLDVSHVPQPIIQVMHSLQPYTFVQLQSTKQQPAL